MRQDRRAQPKAPINENITAREVRLIGVDGEQIGIVSIDEALRVAEEAKLDLVEISADANPRSAGSWITASISSKRRSRLRLQRRISTSNKSKKSSFVQGRKKGITR